MADDEMYEVDARDWLDSVDVPPPRLEVAQIVQIGRSQVRRRRLLTAGGTVAALAALAAIPVTVPLLPSGGGGGGGGGEAAAAALPVLDCEVAALPLPAPAEGESSRLDDGRLWVVAMDPTGRYVIANDSESPQIERSEDGTERLEDRGGPPVMVLWEDGDPSVIPNPWGYQSTATDVNAQGAVVGYSEDEDGLMRAWVYRDGDVTELFAPAGADGEVSAVAINANGDVIGGTWLDDRHVVVVWPAARLDEPYVLDGPGDGASAEAITDEGLVVGGASVDTELDDGVISSTSRPYLWTADRVGHELAEPAGASNSYVMAARGGWAVGLAGQEPAPPSASPASPAPPPDTELGPARWNLETGAVELLDAAGPRYEYATDVNAAGDVVLAPEEITGDHVANSPPNELLTPVLIRGGEAFVLPEPVAEGVIVRPVPDEGVTSVPEGISDSGEVIVGNATTYQSGRNVPVIWHC